jgi:hypothetical protein
LPEVDSIEHARERVLSIEDEFVDMHDKFANYEEIMAQLQNADELDPTGILRGLYQLDYDFRRHQHEYLSEGRDIGEGGSDFSNSLFYATKKNDNEVSLNPGVLVRGTTVTLVNQTDVDLSPSGTAFYYVYIESWFNLTEKHRYASSTTYPNQSVIDDAGTDYPCERLLIATANVVDGVIEGVYPEHTGELRSQRIWP